MSPVLTETSKLATLVWHGCSRVYWRCGYGVSDEVTHNGFCECCRQVSGVVWLVGWAM